MSLAEGDEMLQISETDFIDVKAAMEKWEYFPASAILHHGKPCCRIAREWIFSTDYSLLNGENPLTGPRWIRQRYTWGPSTWPISWCEAVRQKTLDCGALAALTNEVYAARGVTSYHAQFIQQYTEAATRQWYKHWKGDESTVHWIKEDLIYHEGAAVLVKDNELRLWDPTAGWWVNPKQFGGYGGLVALRFFAPGAEPSTTFKWGAHRVVPNRWQRIETAHKGFAAVAGQR